MTSIAAVSNDFERKAEVPSFVDYDAQYPSSKPLTTEDFKQRNQAEIDTRHAHGEELRAKLDSLRAIHDACAQRPHEDRADKVDKTQKFVEIHRQADALGAEAKHDRNLPQEPDWKLGVIVGGLLGGAALGVAAFFVGSPVLLTLGAGAAVAGPTFGLTYKRLFDSSAATGYAMRIKTQACENLEIMRKEDKSAFNEGFQKAVATDPSKKVGEIYREPYSDVLIGSRKVDTKDYYNTLHNRALGLGS